MNPRAALRMRLAERLGIPDPSALDELPEEVWTQWHALSIVDEWGHDRIADLCAAIHNSLMVAVAKKGGQVSDRDLRKPRDYERKFRWERKPKMQSGEDQFAALAAQLGLTHGNCNARIQNRG